jgi:hypothetical protein
MTKQLHRTRQKTPDTRPKYRAKGWSAERRARQAARIRDWAPWRRSTGPKTAAGRARCSQNALHHGFHTAARRDELRRLGRVLGLAGENIKRLRLMIRLRNSARRSWIDYKPWYADQSGFGRAQLALESLLRTRKAKPDVSRAVLAAVRWAKAHARPGFRHGGMPKAHVSGEPDGRSRTCPA